MLRVLFIIIQDRDQWQTMKKIRRRGDIVFKPLNRSITKPPSTIPQLPCPPPEHRTGPLIICMSLLQLRGLGSGGEHSRERIWLMVWDGWGVVNWWLYFANFRGPGDRWDLGLSEIDRSIAFEGKKAQHQTFYLSMPFSSLEPINLLWSFTKLQESRYSGGGGGATSGSRYRLYLAKN